MNELPANLIVALAGAYAAAGALFAVPFVRWGVSRIDRVASDGTLGFRLIILPGVIALWPLLLCRWMAK